VTLAMALEPSLFESCEMSGDVETRGELTLGATIFDRRHNPSWRPNMDVVMKADAANVVACIANSLALAGSATAAS
jgi:inosine-uridine nucleoside N-ribohydrolase